MNNLNYSHKARSLAAVLIVLMFVSVFSPFTYGAEAEGKEKEVFVSEKADGQGDGTEESPFSDLYEAFAALPEGGIINVLGKVNAYIPNAKAKKEDEDGNIVETDELDMYYIPYPKHSGKITVTSDGEGIISFEKASSGFCFINYGQTEYDNISFIWNKAKPVFCSFGENSHLKINENVEFLGDGAVNLYVCGFAELYSGSYAHAFLTYDPYTPSDSGKINTALFLGKGASVETVWGCGLGRVSADSALVLLPGGIVGTVWGGGQAKHITGSFTFINHGGEVTGSVTADSNGGARPAFSTVIGFDEGDNFSTDTKGYTVEFSDDTSGDKEKRQLFKNCEGIIEIDGMGNFIHMTSPVLEKTVYGNAKLFACTYDEITEEMHIDEIKVVKHVDMRKRTPECDLYFFAQYGADYYVLAERPKTAEEMENGDNPFTGDVAPCYVLTSFLSMLALSAACLNRKRT